MASNKVYEGAKDAIVHSIAEGFTRKALQILYRGLSIVSGQEAEKRKQKRQNSDKIRIIFE
jgi:hypothetical protein